MRFDESGGNDVDGGFPARGFEREGFAQTVQRAFRGGVSGSVAEADLAGEAADVNDAPSFGFTQMSGHRFGQRERRIGVDFEERVPVLGLGERDGFFDDKARRVNQDRRRAEQFGDLVDQFFSSSGRSEIGLHRDGSDAMTRCEFGDEFLGRCGRGVEMRNDVARFGRGGERDSAGSTDATGCSGDQRDGAG